MLGQSARQPTNRRSPPRAQRALLSVERNRIAEDSKLRQTVERLYRLLIVSTATLVQPNYDDFCDGFETPWRSCLQKVANKSSVSYIVSPIIIRR